MRRIIPGSDRPTLTKSACATLDYSFDWTDWLEEDDHVASFVVTTKGVSLVSSSMLDDTVTAVVAGGVPGREAWVKCEITTETVPVKTECRTIHLVVEDR